MQEEAVVRHRWTLDDVGTSITGWRWQRPGAGDGCGRQKRALKRKQEVRGERERRASERISNAAAASETVQNTTLLCCGCVSVRDGRYDGGRLYWKVCSTTVESVIRCLELSSVQSCTHCHCQLSPTKTARTSHLPLT